MMRGGVDRGGAAKDGKFPYVAKAGQEKVEIQAYHLQKDDNPARSRGIPATPSAQRISVRPVLANFLQKTFDIHSGTLILGSYLRNSRGVSIPTNPQRAPSCDLSALP